MSEDKIQVNTTNIAVLQTQVSTVMEDIKEIKVNTAKHEENDKKRHEEILHLVNDLKDFFDKEHKEIHRELGEISKRQAVDKVKLGTLITILATLGSLLLKFVIEGFIKVLT